MVVSQLDNKLEGMEDGGKQVSFVHHDSTL